MRRIWEEDDVCWSGQDGLIRRKSSQDAPFEWWQSNLRVWISTASAGPGPRVECRDPSKPQVEARPISAELLKWAHDSGRSLVGVSGEIGVGTLIKRARSQWQFCAVSGGCWTSALGCLTWDTLWAPADGEDW